MDTAEPTTLSDSAQAIAEAQAAKDAELMASLTKRTKAKKAEAAALVIDEVASAEAQEPITITTDRVPMNRAERRAQVAFYAKVLAESERQPQRPTPYAIPRSERRRRKKGGRRAH